MSDNVKRARRSIAAIVLAPLAVALAIPVWQLGAGARDAAATRLLVTAQSAARILQATRLADPARDAAAATRIMFDSIDATVRVAFYDGAAWSLRLAQPGPEWPEAIAPHLNARITSFDRAVTWSLDRRVAAIAPVKDADDWDVVGAIVAVSTSPDPARMPARPATIALLGWAATAALALLRAGRQGAMLRVTTLALPLGVMIVLGRWPGPGAHGLWAVLAFAGWAVLAMIGFGLGGIAHRPLAAREARRAWGFLAPSLVHLLVFSIGPMAFSLWLSFHEWDLLEPTRPFVGLDNYRALAADTDFLRALRNTAVYILFVPIGMVVALGLALLVNRRIPGVRLLRTVFFLPYITSFVAISLVWRWMFQPDIGLLNHVLAWFGIAPQPWLSSPATALPSLMLMSVWMYAGYMMVLFLAGLQSIPASLYESARIDGAGAWQRFRAITLPLLRPTTLFVLVTMVIFMFQVFTAVYIMTEGGPLHATDVIVYHIYRNAWEYLRMGYASAMAWVLFAIVFVITLVQFRWLGARTTP